jgi:hypothetical protein
MAFFVAQILVLCGFVCTLTTKSPFFEANLTPVWSVGWPLFGLAHSPAGTLAGEKPCLK